MRVLAAVFGALFALAAPAGANDAHAGPRPTPSRTPFISAASVPRLPGGLSADEREALLAGDIVARPMVFEKNGGRYVGGVSYQLVRAVPAEVLAAVSNVSELPSVLPRTESATLIDASERGTRIELVQGNSVARATYTVLLASGGPGEVRFWLDASRPHDILDVWGYFRARPFGADKTLVTVAVALDVGPGLVRLLFEERIQRLALETPRHIKDYVEPRALAAR
jgi:hypothetical protein